jgi:YegS/Rv2252/BmrU family lipid kinase
MRICIVFNPAARGEKAAAFREHLGELPADCSLKPTYEAGSGRTLAAAAVHEGHEVIVAAGGDGTVNEVINGIGDVPDGFARVCLGILPLGTVNVFAKELGLPTAFSLAWRVVRQGKQKRIDLPMVEYSDGSVSKRRYFAQLAGAGLDSRAIQLVNWEWKKRVGPLAYVWAGFQALTEHQPALIASGPRDGARGELVLIGNGRYYGGRLVLFPDASLEDGLIDVTVFPKINWMSLFRAGWGMLSERICQATGAITFQTPTLTLTCEGPRLFELDGENVGSLPCSFTLITKVLRVLVS